MASRLSWAALGLLSPRSKRDKVARLSPGLSGQLVERAAGAQAQLREALGQALVKVGRSGVSHF